MPLIIPAIEMPQWKAIMTNKAVSYRARNVLSGHFGGLLEAQQFIDIAQAIAEVESWDDVDADTRSLLEFGEQVNAAAAIINLEEGGPGSGHHGHRGITGTRGGSLPSGGGGGLQFNPSKTAVKKAAAYAISCLGFYKNTDEAVRLIEAEMLQESSYELCRRDNIEACLAIVESGRWKTQFETGTSSGWFDIEGRKESEKAGLGIPTNIPNKKRPVYGYLEDPNYEWYETRNARMYGKIKWVFKDQVKDRSRMTLGDSGDLGLGICVVGTPIRSPHIEGAGREGPAILKGYRREYYTETQTEGGLTLEDVARVHIPTSMFDQRYAELGSALEKKGIQVIYED